jgi:hypothetical protein
VNELMREIRDQKPPVTTRRLYEPVHQIRRTLREHYRKKRDHYGLDHPGFYDPNLRRLFSDAPEHKGNPTAASFLKRVRRELRTTVARWTGENQYTIDQVLKEISVHCREQRLRLRGAEAQTKQDMLVLLSVQTMNYLHGGRYRVAL